MRLIPENVKEIVKAELIEIMPNIEAYKTGKLFILFDQYRVFGFSFDTENLNNQDDPINAKILVSTKSALLNHLYEKVNEYIEQGKHLPDGHKAADLHTIEYSLKVINNHACLILSNRQSIMLFDLEKCDQLVYEFFKDKSNWTIWVRNLDREPDIRKQNMPQKTIYIEENSDIILTIRAYSAPAQTRQNLIPTSNPKARLRILGLCVSR